jgi:alkanesulfonate monooxygenase SsuD/methylene tetrahydromethanopterin reductase-like flavin-dependent oxidoreductase (luciferase family)
LPGAGPIRRKVSLAPASGSGSWVMRVFSLVASAVSFHPFTAERKNEGKKMQIWITGVASPRGTARVAAQLEEAGWDGLLVVDSQNLSGDPYVALAMAATVTQRLGLGTGVTNSVTRHAAVTACSIASVQRLSNGRAVLGIGRGDSALAHLGRAPARLPSFERYLRQVRAYLHGESVPFADIADVGTGTGRRPGR